MSSPAPAVARRASLVAHTGPSFDGNNLPCWTVWRAFRRLVGWLSNHCGARCEANKAAENLMSKMPSGPLPASESPARSRFVNRG